MSVDVVSAACAALVEGAPTWPSAMASLVTVFLLARPRRVLDRDLLAGLESGGHLDLVEAREAGLDLAHVELLLPAVLVLELGVAVLAAVGEYGGEQAALLGRLRGLRLPHVDDFLVLLAEERLDRHGEHLLAALADHVDVRGHARPELGALAVHRDLDVE